MPKLPDFPYPIYFVHGNLEKWPEVVSAAVPPDPDELHWKFFGGNNNWVMHTYLRLKREGLNVHLTDKLQKESICVVAYFDLLLKDLPYGSYVVACRHDVARPAVCDHTIVQNPMNVQEPTDHHIHHWPQPGLIPRDPARGNEIRLMTYKGCESNLYEPFRHESFRNELQALGVEFHLAGKREAERGGLQWHDYSQDDLVLAVRDLTQQDYLSKPSSKLVNAWLSGTPALLGPEPAYRDLRRSDLDYMEVRSPQEALSAVKRLKDHPELYEAMRANCARRAEELNAATILERWHSVLAGPVTAGFERWLRASWARRHMGRPLRFAVQAVKHKYYVREYLRARDHGYRPVSGTYT